MESEKRFKDFGVVFEKIVGRFSESRNRTLSYAIDVERLVQRPYGFCQIQCARRKFAILPFATMQALEIVGDQEFVAENRHLVKWKEVRDIAREQLVKIDVDMDLEAPVESLSVANRQLIIIAASGPDNSPEKPCG